MISKALNTSMQSSLEFFTSMARWQQVKNVSLKEFLFDGNETLLDVIVSSLKCNEKLHRLMLELLSTSTRNHWAKTRFSKTIKYYLALNQCSCGMVKSAMDFPESIWALVFAKAANQYSNPSVLYFFLKEILCKRLLRHLVCLKNNISVIEPCQRMEGPFPKII